MSALASKPGITPASILSIPDTWNPAWFKAFVGNQLKGADVRNATGVGCTVSGNLTSPYGTITVGGSASNPGKLPFALSGANGAAVLADSSGALLLTAGGGLTTDSLGNIVVGSAPANNTYYLIATLPASTGATYDNVVVSGSMNNGWAAVNTSVFEAQFGNRGGFSGRVNNISGLPLANQLSVGLQAYTNAGITNIYVKLSAGSFTYCSFDMRNGSGSATLYSQTAILASASTTLPAGTLVFDTTLTSQALQTEYLFAPTLGTNIANFGAPFATAQYSMNGGGRVSLRGLIAGTGVTTGSTLFTLPAGFRPANTEMFCCFGAQAGGVNLTICRIDVAAGGAVTLTSATNGNPVGYLSLSGINFLANY